MSKKEFVGNWIQAPQMDYGPDDRNYYLQNPNPIFTQTFEITDLNNIKLKIAALGYYIVRINDNRVGNFELNNDWTDFSKRIYYDEYDVTDLIKKGKNEIEVELGNGMYNPVPLRLFGKYNLRQRLARIGEPKFILNLFNNEDLIQLSNKEWLVHQGNITMNNLYLGEHVDFTQSKAKDVSAIEIPVDKQDQKNMSASFIPKIKRTGIVTPSHVSQVENDVLIDFGETISGFISLAINGYAHQNISLKYSETMENGKLLFNTSYAGNIGEISEITGGPGAPEKAIQEDQIICREGSQTFENKFTYHSFRYVLISNVDKNDLSKIKAVYVHTSLEQIGKVATDNNYLNQLFTVGIRTKLNNVHSVFEDCARERLGYGGDIVALANSNLYSFDLKKFYEKTISDFVLEQTKNGGIPETAPYMGIQTNGTGRGEGPILWQLVLPYLLWKHYQFYGDKTLVSKYYEAAKKQYDYLQSIPVDKLANDCIGDHGSILVKSFYDKTPDKLLIGYCTILGFSILMERLAIILNRNTDADKIDSQKETLIKTIKSKFSNDDRTLGQGTQSDLAFAILLKLGDKQTLLKALIKQIKTDNGIFTAGIFGMPVLYRVLHENGYDDIVDNWLKQKSEVGFYNMLSNGNQVLSELFRNKHSSANHAMFSSYIQWYYEALGGIQISNSAVGCSDIIINPYFDKGTNHVDCQLKTVAGTIQSKWQRIDQQIELQLQIPKDITYHLNISDKYHTKSSNTITQGNYVLIRCLISEE
ncbi:family 78 glycoside hydrolase catalytic domain [Companilactobacillus sp. HBUAS56275]|uniref:family 78 glycoside hydrolase catalytic domain n=1 Tax=Companilactobacillus sp. HBUAS56275 TaxID=3109364 RepID=UPI002FF1F0A1